MSDIEMFHVGENSEGEELYNLRYVKGGRSLPTPSMTKAEALARINGTKLDAAMDTPPPAEKSYKDMTKKELELFMREHDIELDRRKTKDDLLKQVDEFFEG
jgi:hypothetical protein